MRETPAEIAELQALLDRSRAGASEHLRDIVDEQRALSATDLAGLLTGMRVLSVATVTRRGEPRIAALDGHFLHGRWVVSTSGTSVKARHLQARPQVSAAYLEGEDLGVFTHGNAHLLAEGEPGFAETLDHLIAHYGQDPRTWGPDIRLYRIDPAWMVGYAHDRERVRGERLG